MKYFYNLLLAYYALTTTATNDSKNDVDDSDTNGNSPG